MRKFILYFIFGVVGLCIPFSIKPIPGVTYNCTSEEKELIQEYLSYNDKKVLDLLGTYNATISVKDEVYSDKGSSCYGYIKMRDNVITLDIEKGQIESTTNHEIGHLVDYEYTDKVLSLEDDFCDIYIKEQGWFDWYNSGCSSECFAQSYKYYVEGNLEFKKNCPGLWEYMDKLLKGVE